MASSTLSGGGLRPKFPSFRRIVRDAPTRTTNPLGARVFEDSEPTWLVLRCLVHLRVANLGLQRLSGTGRSRHA